MSRVALLWNISFVQTLCALSTLLSLSLSTVRFRCLLLCSDLLMCWKPVSCHSLTRRVILLLQYWEKAEFPFHYIPKLATLGLAGGTTKVQTKLVLSALHLWMTVLTHMLKMCLQFYCCYLCLEISGIRVPRTITYSYCYFNSRSCTGRCKLLHIYSSACLSCNAHDW